MRKHEFFFSDRYQTPLFEKDILIALNDSITETEKDIFRKQSPGRLTEGYWPMLMYIKGEAAVWTLTRVH